ILEKLFSRHRTSPTVLSSRERFSLLYHPGLLCRRSRNVSCSMPEYYLIWEQPQYGNGHTPKVTSCLCCYTVHGVTAEGNHFSIALLDAYVSTEIGRAHVCT